MTQVLKRPVLDRPKEAQVEATAEHAAPAQPLNEPKHSRPVDYVWGLLRISMGWLFFWSFLDKMFGLGFATQSGAGWLAGGSPSEGFLTFATKGPFVEFFQGLAGNPVVDWIYMLGMLGMGVALLLGIGVRLAAVAGVVFMASVYAASAIQPANNPFLDSHVIYALVLIGLALAGAGRYMGLGGFWARIPLVRRYPALQ
jgi:thiosulfate dehydrogenase (quinone) large subunit